MKATINADGVLTVVPDNETEAYALRQWLTNWRPETRADDAPTINTPSGLRIAWFDLEDPAA